MGSSSNSPSAQTIARPDPFFAALLGPARRVGNKQCGEKNPESLKRKALQGRESQQSVMFARERSARGQMKSPAIAQRGEGGARGGSGELNLVSLASPQRSVTLGSADSLAAACGRTSVSDAGKAAQ